MKKSKKGASLLLVLVLSLLIFTVVTARGHWFKHDILIAGANAPFVLAGSDLQAPLDALPLETLAFSKDDLGAIIGASGKRPINARLTHCTIGYFDLIDLPVKYGRLFFSSDKGLKYAIISSSAATALFAREDCIGEMIRTNDDIYAILGVYQSMSNPIARLSQDFTEPAYFLMSDEEAPDFIYGKMKGSISGGLALSSFTQALNGAGVHIAQAADLSALYNGAFHVLDLYLLLLLLQLGWFAKRRYGGRVKCDRLAIREAYARSYFPRFIASSARPLLRLSIAAFVCFCWLWLLITLYLSHFRVNEAYIPASLLFDDVNQAWRRYAADVNAYTPFQHPFAYFLCWAKRLFHAAGILTNICVLLMFRTLMRRGKAK